MATSSSSGGVADIGNNDFYEQAGPFAVIPASWCPHLPALIERLAKSDGVLPENFAADPRCRTCGSFSESWVCLGCNGTFCSRFVAGDMLKHYEEALAQASTTAQSSVPSISNSSTAGPSTSKADVVVNNDHALVLSLTDLSVWCYACDIYVHNEVLQPFKRAAFRVKFGEEAPADTPL